MQSCIDEGKLVRTIDLGDHNEAAGVRRPLDLTGIADEGRRIAVAFAGPGIDELTAGLLYAA